MHTNIGNSQAGYVALTSVIIMSLLLLTITAGLSSANYFSRLNILKAEFKARSSSLARGCFNYAAEKIASDPNYAGGGSDMIVPIGTDSCAVISVLPSGAVNWPKTIIAQATYPGSGSRKSFTNLKAQVDNSLNLIFWQECLTPACP